MKKKLLIVADTMTKGGTEKVIVDTLKMLNYSRFDVTLLIIQKIEEAKKNIAEIPDKVRIKYVFNKPLNHRYQILLYYILMFFPHKIMKKILVKEEFDIILTTRYIFAFPFSTGKGYKVMWVHEGVGEENENSIFGMIKKRYKKNTYRKFDQILLLTETARIKFCQYYSLHKKCSVLSNPINQKEIIQLSNEPITDFTFSNNLNMVCAARLSVEKGIDRLLDACAQLANNGFTFNLLILGDGPEQNKLKNMVLANSSLKDKVVFLGFKDNPYKYMRGCDIYVSPSRSESFSLAIAEAMVLGLPVLSTDCHGPREILDNGKYGLLVKNDNKNIYEGIKKLFMNPELIGYYRAKSKERKVIFSYEKNIKMLENIISPEEDINSMDQKKII
ncbi:glycosyltransferase [Heyndrickxia oleronia]|uniref:Glycosyl transferase n=1 Tax=Heyndrickxia oleronia TaxID=38875 RepID=A0A8E2I4U9_9BACI|nr:glycosyltransferase [Heyndrickxia oleronia]NYV64901.1 glycosyltransferase [Bacillus sp. Gen3]MBU5210417.1 glycosyltransferase [Heyndrickxia oleronia]MEC1374189.1 glycosyltransferase [Heyndrickxia oleronia]OOP66731.1 glycosyl transferase [Heyndrickxia oleronia]QQZ07207.1 glycosyltransferase [Heyndrickxia oleronia]